MKYFLTFFKNLLVYTLQNNYSECLCMSLCVYVRVYECHICVCVCVGVYVHVCVGYNDAR